MATYLDADGGLFEIAEAFFITVLGLWPFPLFFRLSSSIRLPLIVCRILGFGLNQPSGVVSANRQRTIATCSCEKAQVVCR
jgi:hypothetical protein